MISLRFTAIESENVKVVISYRAAVTATDTLIARLQPIGSYEKNYDKVVVLPSVSDGKMLGTSEGTFYPLSRLWCKSPQTEFFGPKHERFLYKVELKA